MRYSFEHLKSSMRAQLDAEMDFARAVALTHMSMADGDFAYIEALKILDYLQSFNGCDRRRAVGLLGAAKVAIESGEPVTPSLQKLASRLTNSQKHQLLGGLEAVMCADRWESSAERIYFRQASAALSAA